MSLTEVSNQSWLGRLGGSLKTVLIGLLLFVVSFAVLFWNEGRSVRRFEDLKQGRDNVVSVSDITSINAAMEGKLVHMSGSAETDEIVSDPDFGVKSTVLALHRKTEMYQWKEIKTKKEKKSVGGGTKKVVVYEHEKVWTDEVIDSDEFNYPEGHNNPGIIVFPSETLKAKDVTFGAFTLNDAVLSEISNYEDFAVEFLTVNAKKNGAKLRADAFYIGEDPDNPRIGDLHITYQIVKPQDITLIAKQIGTTFEAAQMDNGELLLVSTGIVPVDMMFAQAEASNAMMTWILRLVGFILMFAGLVAILTPISVILDIIPLLGNIAEIGIRIVCFLITVALSSLIIAISWLFHRPLIAILLLLVVGGAVAAIIFLKKNRQLKNSIRV